MWISTRKTWNSNKFGKLHPYGYSIYARTQIHYISNTNSSFILFRKLPCSFRISKLIDGIILIPGQESEVSAKLLKFNNIPFVFVDRYKEIMTEHGIYNKSLIFESKFSLEGGIEITNQIIDKCESVDSIFYSNDIIAIGGIKTLTKKRI